MPRQGQLRILFHKLPDVYTHFNGCCVTRVLNHYDNRYTIKAGLLHVILAFTDMIALGQRNYFMAYGILFHKLPDVAIIRGSLRKKNMQRPGFESRSVLHLIIRHHPIYQEPVLYQMNVSSSEIFDLSREVIPLTHSATISQVQPTFS